MKKYLAGLLLILITICCTSKKEGEVKVVDNNYIFKPVGVVSNGSYHVINVEENSEKWSKSLRESFNLPDNVSFSKFEIVKNSVPGNGAENSYLLLTHTQDGFSQIGVMLQFKDGKFYFDVNTEGKRPAVLAIICKETSAVSGCVPAVVVYEGKKRLVCSTNGCDKVVSEISF